MTNEENLKALLASELREDDETFTPYDGALVVRNDSALFRDMMGNFGFFTPKSYAFVDQGIEFSLEFYSDFRNLETDVSFHLLRVRALAEFEMYPEEARLVEDKDCENVVLYVFHNLEAAKKAFSAGISDALLNVKEINE